MVSDYANNTKAVLKEKTEIHNSPAKRRRLDNNSEEHNDECVFKQTVEDDDLCVLSEDNNPIIIRSCGALKWKLEQRMKGNKSFIETFLISLRQIIEDSYELRKLLLPSINSYRNDVDDNAPLAAPQDSLIQVLLAVSSLQKDIVQMLLIKFIEFQDESELSAIDSQLPRLILSQLRFLESVFSESELAEYLMETISNCSSSRLQKEVIRAVPEIVTDSTHSFVVSSLDTLMTSNTEMTVSVLDAMSNLTLSAELKSKVSERVLMLLDSTAVDDLPVVLRFLFQNATKFSVDKVTKAIVESLQFVGVARTKHANQSITLVIESLRRGINYHSLVALSLLKGLEKGNVCAPIECWLLFLLEDTPKYRKVAERIFRKRVASGTLSFSLITHSVIHNTELIFMLSKPALCMADSLLQSNDARIRFAGQTIYESVYKYAGDNASKRIIIENIITHVGAGNPCEIDSALKLLLSLVQSDVCSVRPFMTFLKGLLDYCDSLTITQLRLVFNAFSLLECHDGSNGSEVIIVIKKLVDNPRIALQRIGIIGCVSMIIANANSHELNTDKPPASLVQYLLTHIQGNSAAISVLCDEIIMAMNEKSIPDSIIDLIEGDIMDLFQARFARMLIPDENELVSSVDITVEALPESSWWSLDNENAILAIKILPTLIDAKNRCDISALSEMVEFVERVAAGDGEPSNDAFLGAPLLMPNHQVFMQDSELNPLDEECVSIAHSSLVYAITWIHSLLNCFASSTNANLRFKIGRRLHHLLRLHDMIRRNVPDNFVPVGLDCRKKLLLEHYDAMHCKASVNSSSSCSLDRLSVISRRINPKVYYLFAAPLVLSLSPNDSEFADKNDASDTDLHLYIDTFLFLLQDFSKTLKCSMANRSSLRSAQSTTLSVLSNVELRPVELLNALGYELKHDKTDTHTSNKVPTTLVWGAIGVHMRAVFEAIGSEEMQSRVDCDVITQLMVDAVSTTMSALSSVLACEDLQSGDEALLQALAINDFCGLSSRATIRLSEARKNLFTMLAALLPHTLISLNMNVLVVSMLQGVVGDGDCDDAHDLKTRLSDIARELLSSEWSDTHKYNAKNVGVLCRLYVQYSDDAYERIKYIATEVLSEFTDDGANSHIDFSSTLNKKTMILFFKPCVSQVILMVEKLQETSFLKFLKRLRKLTAVFSSLLDVAINFPTNPILSCVIFGGRGFTDNTLKHIPLMSKHFDQCRRSVLETVDRLQKCQQTLQRICLHVKRAKVSAIMARVPVLKRSMELFLHRVKRLFYDHKILGEFKSGRVKRRGLDGQRLEDSDHSESDVANDVCGDAKNGDDNDDDDDDDDDDDIKEAASDDANTTISVGDTYNSQDE